MSATDYRKFVVIQREQFIGVECSDGTEVVLMCSGLSGYSPRLTAAQIDDLIDALVEAKQVMS